MSNFLQLPADGLVDGLYPMTVHVAPEAGHAVDVAVALGVDQERPFPSLDDQGRLASPLCHGGERMPQMSVIQVGKALGLRRCGDGGGSHDDGEDTSIRLLT